MGTFTPTLVCSMTVDIAAKVAACNANLSIWSVECDMFLCKQSSYNSLCCLYVMYYSFKSRLHGFTNRVSIILTNWCRAACLPAVYIDKTVH